MKLSSIIWKAIGFIGETVGYVRGYNPAPWRKRPNNPLYEDK